MVFMVATIDPQAINVPTKIGTRLSACDAIESTPSNRRSQLTSSNSRV